MGGHVRPDGGARAARFSAEGPHVSTVHQVQHPLVDHHLARLRHVGTDSDGFRRTLRQLTSLLAFEATRDLAVRDHSLTTPLQPTTGRVVRDRVGLVPILRAGLGMVEPVLGLLPEAEVWHLGLYRDERTATPVEYYRKLPDADPVDLALVLDPMLATGGSATAALETLTHWGVPRLKLLAIIAAEEGIRVVQQSYPQVPIHVCAVDPELNADKFIVPGLGDAGDRLFNTVR